MSTIIKKILLITVLFPGLHYIFAQTENPVISAIQKEVDRNKAELKMEGMMSPFFISYSVVDVYTFNLSASLGKISSYSENHRRFGLPTLLVGDYHRNNLNVPGRMFIQQTTTSLIDNVSGIPVTIWKDLDNAYKSAVEQYKTKMAILQQQTQTKEEQDIPNFEQTKPVNIILQPLPVDFNKSYWENYLRKVSETAKQFPEILSSNVTLYTRNVMNYTYNTEGSRYAVPTIFYQLTFTANTRADDGQELTHTFWLENASLKQMPDVDTFSARCKTVMENLVNLKKAPVIDDTYCGPVLFEGRSVARIFWNEFFNNNKMSASPKSVQTGASPVYYMIDGEIRTASSGGNDFESMLNKKVISRSITMKSITGQEFYKGQKLNGYYPVDAEGVAPDKELMLIDNGVLRNMLSGRKPTLKIHNSNGHTRFDFGSNNFKVMAGNILITSNQTYSNSELRKKLLAAAKEEDLEYAYIVKQYEQGNNLMYKIYVDDGREELVRGATVSDLGIRSFKRILGASDKEQIWSFGETQMTLIYPDALLFEELDIIKMPNIEFKKPYIVQKPN